MSEDIKLNAESQDMTPMQEEQSMFNFQNIYAMLVLNWQWFLLSLFICVCGALIYLRYAQPVYQVSAKMLIKDDQNNRRSSPNQMLANMQDFGFMTNSAGIENEIEILQSHVLSREAIKDLKIYTEYWVYGRLSKHLVYDQKPFVVDLDEESLTKLDKDLLYSNKSFSMKVSFQGGKYEVTGETLLNGNTSSSFAGSFTSLPAKIKTKYGTLSFLRDKKSTVKMKEGDNYLVTIRPPMAVAKSYIASMSVAPTSKQTSIAELTLKNQNTRRGLDFLNQLAICYNRQANADKNEIALKTEEFINGRLEKIDAELGSTENSLESYKKRNAVTSLEADAAQSLTQSSQYESKLSEANSQIQLLDYLREFVDNPRNEYKIIPSNIGLNDPASTALIASYNQSVQDRNRLLRSASEEAPQVRTLTANLGDLQSSIRTALLQARRSADIQRQSIQRQYSKYQSRIGSTPEKERVLTQIGRQQEVKSGLYLLLLQKREENSISLAATADKGKLIDEPQSMGKVSP